MDAILTFKISFVIKTFDHLLRLYFNLSHNTKMNSIIIIVAIIIIALFVFDVRKASISCNMYY